MLKLLALASLLFLESGISPTRFIDNVKYLSSDELKGRGNSLPELQKAARYVEAQFKTCGLKPVNGGYFQKYSAVVGSQAGPNNSLGAYVRGTDFQVMGFSDSGKFSGKVVFAGYGISWAPHYDDYAGIDVKGKIVLVLRHMPAENKMFDAKAGLVEKALTAKSHGAAAMLLVNDLGNHKDDGDPFVRFDSVSGPEHLGIPVMQVTRAVADRLLGKPLAEAEAEVDKDMEPHSRELGVTIAGQADVVRTTRELENVIGELPGSDRALKDQVIVIGAHYDHLGFGDNHSLAPDKLGQIHHGADDNASGTAGIIELACSMRAAKHQRGIVFLAFSGEELGLYGSDAYVKHPLIPIEKVEAMINLDMIGRVKDGKLFIGDVGTAAEFRGLLEEEAKASPGLKVEYSSTGTDSSDHLSFVLAKVPSLFFFSGLHADYHKPTDTWEKIDAKSAVEVLGLVERVVMHLDRLSVRPVFVKVAEPPRPVGGEGSGYGPWFGSIPDMGESEHGVKFADIRPGSPADVAGLKPGDVMVEWDGEAINNLYDFTHQLQNKKVGDKVRVTVLRGAEKIVREVTLAKRP